MNTDISFGSLYIVSTPIGNLQDITIRALKTLFEVDLIYSEQKTKTASMLFQLKNTYPEIITSPTSPKMFSMNEFEEDMMIPEIIQRLEEGKQIAVVSEAGTPLLSDPGFRLVRETTKRGIRVIPIPGASSITAALSVSGLPTDKFFFAGFLPKQDGKKKHYLEKLKLSLETLNQNDLTPTIILFESPHRLPQTLTSLNEVFGDIELVVAHELTKIHESIEKKAISEHRAFYETEEPKGEFVLLFNLKRSIP